MADPILTEDYYRDAAPTTRLEPLSGALDDYLPRKPLPLLLAFLPTLWLASKLGALLSAPDYPLLALLVVVACYLVSWGNRHAD